MEDKVHKDFTFPSREICFDIVSFKPEGGGNE